MPGVLEAGGPTELGTHEPGVFGEMRLCKVDAAECGSPVLAGHCTEDPCKQFGVDLCAGGIQLGTRHEPLQNALQLLRFKVC